MSISPLFRQLVAGITDEAGWAKFMAHVGASLSEGLCPMCAGPLDREPVDAHRHTGHCLHGYCPSCRHFQNFDPDLLPERELNPERVRSILGEVIETLDSGGLVRFQVGHEAG